MTDDGNTEADEKVMLLIRDEHFIRVDDLTIEIVRDLDKACSPGRRLILSDDLRYTYLVERIEPAEKLDWSRVETRRGRPITNSTYVRSLLTDADR
jgi:hypothetical protein